MTANKKKKAQEALLFLSEKHDGMIKGCMVYNGKPTREWLSKEDSASPPPKKKATDLLTVPSTR